MDKNDSIIFASFMCLFIIMTAFCSCCDRIINKPEISKNPPKYEELYTIV